MKKIGAVAGTLIFLIVGSMGCSDSQEGTDPGGLILQMLGSPAVEKPSRVTLKFTVATADGKPVPGLKNSNFSISEDGKTLSPAESDHRIIPTPKGFEFFSVLLLDMSGSMIGDIPKLQQAANSFIDAVPVDLEVGIFTFDGRTTLEQQLEFTTSKSAMKKAVTALSNYKVVDKSTNLYGAVLEGIKKLKTRKAKAAAGKETSGFMVLFTDGTDQASIKTAAEAKSAVDDARTGDLSFFSIGLGKEINKTELQNFGPDGFQFAGDSSKLNTAFQTIAAALKALSDRYYLLAYCSPKRAGSHKLTLRVTWNGNTGTLTATFSAVGFKGGCNPLGPDGGVADGSVGDRGVEAGLPDKGTDMKKRDGAIPDMKPVDKAVPDKAIPDNAIIIPDKALPDQAPLGDMMQPDKNDPDMPIGPDSGQTVATNWIKINAGNFQMGSPTNEPCREVITGIKETQHSVTLTHSFLIADHEVTQGDFKKLMGNNPSHYASCGSNCPVERVTFPMAAAYCNALSKKDGLKECYVCTGSGNTTTCVIGPSYKATNFFQCPGYRIPTEAEWEMAYRAGTSTALYNGVVSASSCASGSAPNANKIAWYLSNSSGKTHPVKGKLPNALGIYDMAGNVFEWTQDWFLADLGGGTAINPFGGVASPHKIAKGGSAQNSAGYQRAAYRNKVLDKTVSTWVGFRCVRSLPNSCPLPAGVLDKSFSSTGYVTHDGAIGSSASEVGTALTIDGAGRIVVVGSADYAKTAAVWRYLSNGTIDSSFGTKGVITIPNGHGRAVRVDSKGRIVVAGSCTGSNGAGALCVWRLTTSGALDSTFGTNGRFLHQGAAGGTGVNTASLAHAVVIDSAGRIILGGMSTNASYNYDAVLWRLTSSGTLDKTFASNGIAVSGNLAGGNSTDAIKDILLDPSGRLVAVGWSYGKTTIEDCAIWRFTDKGVPDSTFGTGGAVLLDNLAGGNGHDLCRSVSLDSQSNLLVSAYSQALAGLIHYAVLRLTKIGKLDKTFGGTGIIHGAAGAGGDRGGSIFPDSSGRIIMVGGTRDANGKEAPIARRFKANGSVDACFGNAGQTVFDVHNSVDPPGGKCGAWKAVLHSNKIIASGCRANGANVDMAIYRLK